MTKKVICGICHTKQEVIETIPEGDSIKLVLKCTHIHTDISKSIMEPNVPINDELSVEVRHLVSFESDYDKVEGIYALIEAKSGFTGITKDKFYFTREQINYLKSMKINVKSTK